MQKVKDTLALLIVVGILFMQSHEVAFAYGQWTTKAPMPTERYSLACAAVNGKIYAIGGWNSSSDVLGTVEAYDPAFDTWTGKASMPGPRASLAAAVVNGKIYAIGGYDGSHSSLATMEEYDPATDSWTTKAPMPTDRSGPAAAVVNGKIYAIGGYQVGMWEVSTVEEYDPATDTWTTKASMPTRRHGLAAAVVSGKIYALGGVVYNASVNYSSVVEEYDPGTNSWTTKASMPTGRHSPAAAVVNGKIYVIGGKRGTAWLSTVEKYDPPTDTWTTEAPMPARCAMGAAVVNDSIYVVGGQDATDLATQVVEEFSPGFSLYDVVWAQRAGGSGRDRGRGIAVLADGSALVTGTFSDTATFGPIPLISAGTEDIFVAKYNTDGTVAWVQGAGGSQSDDGFSIAALSDSSAVVTGSFQDTATFGSIILTSPGGDEIFVAKYNSTGTVAWATRAGASMTDVGVGVGALSDDTALVTGVFEGTATFGSTTTLTSAGPGDMFLAKYNPNGTVDWVKSAGGSGCARGAGIAVLADGSALITGWFQGTMTFDSIPLTSSGYDEIFVAKYNPDGTVAWAKRAGGSGGDYGHGIAVLADGSALVTGYFEGSATFESATLISSGGGDIFVAKYYPDGTLAWAKRAGGSGADVGNGIGVLADGSALVTGYFEGSATFESTTLISGGGSDIFVAKYYPDGTLAWATQAGGSGADSGKGIAMLADGSALVTGYFQNTATLGSTTLISAGGDEIFVAKFVPAIVVESREGGSNYGSYSETGSWHDSVAKSTAFGITPGIGSRWVSSEDMGATAKFSLPGGLPSGLYKVDLTWGTSSSNRPDVAVDIVHADGVAYTFVDQTANFNTWVSVGSYNFESSGSVTIHSSAAVPGAIRSDAVGFVWSGPPGAPTPTPTPTSTPTPTPTPPGPTPTPTATPAGYISAPTGLTATGGATSILLQWNPNPESNLAGYNVYRDTSLVGDFSTKLNLSLVPDTTYSDVTASSGVICFYKVTAVNDMDIESAMSEAAWASIGTIEVWMPDVRGPADADVRLPINVTYATGITGNGMDIKITYDKTLLTPVEVQKTVLTQDFTFVDNISVADGQVNISGISAAGATITGEGHILDILFHVSASAVEDSSGYFIFVEVKMYDATPNLLSVDYSDIAIFTVSPYYILGDVSGDGVVDSADALMALQISTGERTPTDLQLLAGDVNGDGVIDSADVTLILRLAVGLPVNPPGGGSASAPLPELLLAVSSTTYHLEIGDASGDPWTQVSIPVTIDNAQGVAGLDLVVNFDPSVLDLDMVTKGSLFEAGFALDYEESSGSVDISLASSQELSSGSGVVVWLHFTIVGQPTNTSSLLPAYVKLNGQYGEDRAWTASVTKSAGVFTATGTTGVTGEMWMLYQ